MKVFKATDEDMTCHMGDGIFQYELGVPAVVEKSKCGNTGLHACEYVVDCMIYYGLSDSHRFFEAEATGDIAEDGINTRIACTELTLIRELTNRDIAREAIRYMVRHPKRKNWPCGKYGIMIAQDKAFVKQNDGIAIARGKNPKVKGCTGAHIGWIRETEDGIQAARLMTVGGNILPDVWYTIEEAEEAMKGGQSETERNTESTG